MFTVIIPYMNTNDTYRFRNLKYVLANYIRLAPDFKYILVEQNGDGNIESYIKTTYPDITYINVKLDYELFHKTKLLNTACKNVVTEYIIMADADCVITEESIKSIKSEYNMGTIVYPFNSVNYYNEAYTRILINSDKQLPYNMDDRKLPIKRFTGMLNCFSYELFKDVGGFDESFIGWGCEDDAFLIKIERFAGKSYRTTRKTPLIHLFHPKSDDSIYKSSDIYKKNRKRLALINRMSNEDLHNYIKSINSIDTLLDKYEALNKLHLELNWKLGNCTVKLDTTIYNMDNIQDMSISKILQCIYDVDGSKFMHEIIKLIDERVTELTDSQVDEINRFRLL